MTDGRPRQLLKKLHLTMVELRSVKVMEIEGVFLIVNIVKLHEDKTKYRYVYIYI